MVAGVHDPRSLGVHRYVERLSGALAALALDYRPTSRPCDAGLNHFHLANSTRVVVAYAARQRRPFLLTIHDVVPRTAALRPLQRALLPLCARSATTVIVHSRHAAELLAHTTSIAPSRVVVVPLAAPRPVSGDQRAARASLGLAADGPPLFVLPGVLKAAKLVAEALSAARPLLARGDLRLLLAGRVVDERVATEAAAAGAIVLADPGPDAYENAIVAADAVLCMRAASVGETSGPLLDAIGAERPSLITAVGSGPEVAAGSARIVEPSVAGIRAGIEALLDPDERRERAAVARERASLFSWEAAARRHLQLLEELADA